MEQSEILEPVHACLKELLDRNQQGKGDSLQFTDNDVVAMTLLYSHVMNSRFTQTLTDEKVSIGMSKKLITNYNGMVLNLTTSLSGVDVANFYKGKKQD